jgi:hypothetical protein
MSARRRDRLSPTGATSETQPMAYAGFLQSFSGAAP